MLNYHYSPMYRGAFVLNYFFAVCAVMLATLSLVRLGNYSHSGFAGDIDNLISAAAPNVQAVSTAPEPWLMPALIELASLKLLLGLFIHRNTRRANFERCNDRAFDMRYLAERLRALFYLPRFGSFQPPAVYPPQFAARTVRQSHIDWLCEAIVRGCSPASLEAAQQSNIADEHGTHIPIRKRLCIDALDALKRLRDDWVAQQAIYHQAQHDTMHTLHERMDTWQKRLGIAVMVIVALDILLIGGKVAHKLHWIDLPAWLQGVAKVMTPWLILFTAIVTAVIAALGGLRFQSECQRLAERSLVMRRMLAGSATLDPFVQGKGEPSAPTLSDLTKHPQRRLGRVHTLLTAVAAEQSRPDNRGSHAVEALRLAEHIPEDFARESAEWSVLYAKEVSNPG